MPNYLFTFLNSKKMAYLSGPTMTYDPTIQYNQPNLGWSDIGDVAGQILHGIGDNAEAKGQNALATAEINAALAESIRSRAENNKQITRTVALILLVAVVSVAVVALVSNFYKK